MILLIGLIPGITGVAVLQWPLVESYELRALDILFLARGVQEPPRNVRVVAIDDISLSELEVPATGGWPRRLNADLVRTLAREGAAAIAFDMVFDTPGDAEEDRDFVEAIGAAGNVVLGSIINVTRDRYGSFLFFFSAL